MATHSTNTMHPNNSPVNFLETALSVIFSVCSLAWAHFTNTDGIVFKIVVAPMIAGTIGYFTAKFWKWLFKEKS